MAYILAQVTGWGPPVVIRTFTPRSRILPSGRGTDSSLKEPMTNCGIVYV